MLPAPVGIVEAVKVAGAVVAKPVLATVTLAPEPTTVEVADTELAETV